MNTKSLILIPAGLAAVLIPLAVAVEAPQDDAPPPPPAPANNAGLPEIKLPAAPEVKVESAFLGIVSGEVPEMLADHLDLKSGEGVVVRSLVPDGPAAKAGIAVHDVILKVAGEPVGSPQEISDRITARKPGEEVAVDYIHKGKPASLDLTLGVRPAELAAAGPAQLDQFNFEGLPRELAERVREAIEGNFGPLELGDGADQIPEALLELERRMKRDKDMGLKMPDDAVPGGKFEMHGEANVRMLDGQGSVEVKVKDGAKVVTIRDHQDNVTWKGPWDTAQDKAAAPDDVRQRVESLNIDSTFKGGGLRLQLRQPAAPDADQE